MIICKNCGNQFEGRYCNQCGERIVNDRDFSVFSIARQALGSITSFDSKLLRTMKLLLFYPGKLSTEFVNGVRAPYMRPFQILIVVNILFYMFMSELDLFRSPSQGYFVENFDGVRVMEKVRQISQTRGLEVKEIAIMYDNRSSDLAKGLIVCLIPFIALTGLLLHLKSKIEFGKHLIFATHYLSFIIVVIFIIGEGLIVLPITPNRWLFIVPSIAFITLYYIVALKHFYQDGWLGAVAKGLVGVVLINVFIQFYRVAINIISLNTLL